MQIDFGEKKRITALATQGRDVYFEHVKSYSLAFSDDRRTWHEYREGTDKKVSDPQMWKLKVGIGLIKATLKSLSTSHAIWMLKG